MWDSAVIRSSHANNSLKIFAQDVGSVVQPSREQRSRRARYRVINYFCRDRPNSPINLEHSKCTLRLYWGRTESNKAEGYGSSDGYLLPIKSRRGSWPVLNSF
ncbi:uncharacterized protein LOC143201059 [Rhynchophorus ferrugineus]|uniref:uncharacterized protein LOC143201059 n=1 Tax=Rhynchophorus ferrugineus TaxID=354439 RepID=UPI003FCCDD30